MSTTEAQLKRLENKLHNTCSFYINTGGVGIKYFKTAIKLLADKKVALDKIESSMSIYCDTNKCKITRLDELTLILSLYETSEQKTALAEIAASHIGTELLELMKMVLVKKEKYLESLIELNKIKKEVA